MKAESFKSFPEYAAFPLNYFLNHTGCVIKPDLGRNTADKPEDCIKAFQKAFGIFAIREN